MTEDASIAGFIVLVFSNMRKVTSDTILWLCFIVSDLVISLWM